MKNSISNRVSQRSNIIMRCIGLSVVVIALNLGAVSVAQAATDCNAVTEISTAECKSLLELYNSTDGANWTNNEGWNVTDTPCSWYGVTCLNGGVSEINFWGNQLTGTIPDFSGLPNLEKLWLMSNQLTGTIPDFSALPHLQLLYLSENQLSGPIPDFSALPHLEVLFLSFNHLTGTIPNFTALPNLKMLWLNSNQLTGTIPDFLSVLPNLEKILLDENQLCKARYTDYSTWQDIVDQYPYCPPKPQHTLTIEQTGEGEGNITGNGINCESDCIKEYDENTSIILTATPDADSIFAGWSGACSGMETTCKITMNQAQNVTATFDLIPPNTLKVTTQGKGTVTSLPYGINCGVDCEEPYRPNTSVTLTANPNADYTFAGWGGACSGTGNCNVTMNKDQEVTAIFKIKAFPLTVNKSGTGTGSVEGNGINCGSDCSEDYKANTSVTLIATPTTDSLFDGWNGACSGAETTCKITMNHAQNVTATFDLIPPNSLKVTTQGKGTVTSSPYGINCAVDCEEPYRPNTSVTLTANPNADYTFAGWGGACSGTGNCNVTMNKDQEVTAIFKIKAFPLTVNKSGTGTGSVTGNGINCGSDCSEIYEINTSVTLEATPDADSIFDGWSGACSGTGNCTVSMNQSQNVIATFQPKPVLLTISPTGGGKGIITSDPSGINCGRDCAHEYDNSPVITLTANADADSIFEGWGGACSGDAATCVVKMSSDKTVSAQFDWCKPTVEPTSKTHKFKADKGSITVKVSNDKCPWTAISHNDDWLKITSRQDNHGNGTIDYTVTENRNTEPRDGKLTIAGKKVTLYQGISEKPQASFTTTPLSGMAPLTVKLDANDSSDQDGEIVSYDWTTSDGQTASGKTAELRFAGYKSCRPTITLTVTDNDELSDQADKTLSIENCAIIEFQGIEDYYRIGDFVRAVVKIDVNVGRFKRVDLWVAILMPSGDLIFKTPLGINAFSPFAQPFKESLESQTVEHRFLDFEVPPGLGGTYTFYALIVEEGEEPTAHLDELVIQETILANE